MKSYYHFRSELNHIASGTTFRAWLERKRHYPGPTWADHVLSWHLRLKDFDPNYILHLAAITGMDSLEPSDFNENYVSAELLCRFSGLLPSLKKIIFTSSLLVCRNGYIPASNSDYCPPNGYGHSKALSEIVVRESNISVSWDIVRPTSIWGPWFSGGYLSFFNLVSTFPLMSLQITSGLIFFI